MAQKLWMKRLVSAGVILAAAVVLASASGMGTASAAGLGATAAVIKWTNIAIPLDAGITTADGVASYIDGSNGSIVRVAKWDAATQSLIIRNVGSLFGTPNFSVATGDWLLVGATSSAPTSFSWVGSVPTIGSRTYSIVANGYTSLMLPLDRSDLATADALGTAIGNVTRIARWDAATQSLVIRNVGSPFGTPNFNITAGYPYLILSTQAKSWP